MPVYVRALAGFSLLEIVMSCSQPRARRRRQSRSLQYAGVGQHFATPASRCTLREKIEELLLRIDSRLEFAHREMEQGTADDTKTFCVSYDNMNLVDFVVGDLERRLKVVRASMEVGREIAPPGLKYDVTAALVSC